MTELPTRLVLRGRDHPRPAECSLSEVNGGIALALTRGWKPKPYRYVDPNEDVVAAASHGQQRLLVVADGHNGTIAAEAAVDVVLDRLGDTPPPEFEASAFVEVFFAANEAVRSARRGEAPERAHSRTTLTVVLQHGAELHWASIGDSAAFVVDRAGARELGVPAPHFLGDGVSLRALSRRVSHGSEPLDPDAWVVLVTDGFTNFALPRGLPAVVVARTVSAGERPREVAVGLLDEARQGGAGDNVGLVVAGPAALAGG